jgi:hypothetical protein
MNANLDNVRLIYNFILLPPFLFKCPKTSESVFLFKCPFDVLGYGLSIAPFVNYSYLSKYKNIIYSHILHLTIVSI